MVIHLMRFLNFKKYEGNMFDGFKIGMPVSKFDYLYDDLRRKIWTIHYTVSQSNSWHKVKLNEEEDTLVKIAKETDSKITDVYNALGDGMLRAFSNDLLNKSFYIQVHSFCEVMTYDIAKLCEEEFETEKKLNNYLKSKKLVGSKITRCKLFIENELSLDFSEINTEFEELQILARIRNIIVHADSIIKLEDIKNREMVSYINDSVSMDINDDGLIKFVNPFAVDTILSAIYNFISKVINEIKNIT